MFDDFGFGSFLGNFAGSVSDVANQFSDAIQQGRAAIVPAVQSVEGAYGAAANAVSEISSSVDPNNWGYTGYAPSEYPAGPTPSNVAIIPSVYNPPVTPPLNTNPAPNPVGSFYPASNPGNSVPLGTPTNNDGENAAYIPTMFDTYNSSPFAGSSGVLVIGLILLGVIVIARRV